MIQGHRIEPRPIQRVVIAGDEAAGVEPVTREEWHLFMEPLAYAQHTNGDWHCKPPGGASVKIRGNRSVVEHEDDTITVEGPPFKTPAGVFRLVKGNWIEVDPK